MTDAGTSYPQSGNLANWPDAARADSSPDSLPRTAPPSTATPPSTAAGGASEKGAHVASTAMDQGRQVAGEAKDQAREVAREAKVQITEIMQRTQGEIREQGQARTDRAAVGLRTLATQFDALANGNRREAGALGDYAEQARTKVEQLAGRLETGGFDGLVDDVTRFARRRPGLFLLVTAGAGVFVGRLLKNGGSAASSNGHARDTGGASMALTHDASLYRLPGNAGRDIGGALSASNARERTGNYVPNDDGWSESGLPLTGDVGGRSYA